MISNFSLGVPAQSTKETGMRFSRKSPAVGSMNRHWPFGACMLTEVKARVAVSSRSCDSATAVACKTPPARDTGTASVGLGIPPVPTAVVTGVEAVSEAVDVGPCAVAVKVKVAITWELVCVIGALVSVGASPPAPEAPPNVNCWSAFPASQGATSTTSPLTVKHVCGSLLGANASESLFPLKGNSCESVTSPPPSARPPQLNKMT